MNPTDLWTIARGAAEPPRETVRLSAGNATLYLDGGDVRYYTVNGRELLRRVYVAVRNPAWETPAAVLSPAEISEEPDGGVHAVYGATVADGEMEFAWTGVITLRPSGELSYAMTGTAGSSFDYARIGLNVLHPPALEGRKYRLVTSDGVLEGVIPEGIGPQPFVDGEYYPLLPAFRSLELDLEGPVSAHFEFTGDEFELEDQRNWLDASYKSYSTPMSLALLHADPGQSIAQEVRVRAEGPPAGRSSPPATGRGRVVLQLEEADPAGVYPVIGLGLPADAPDLSGFERELLGRLRPGHLRADLRLSSDDVADHAARAGAAALGCGCGLELAVFVDSASSSELARLKAAVEALEALEAPIRRLFAFSEHELVTSPATVTAVRETVGADLPVFGGTNLNFADLNRDRPDPFSADGFAFSANPQVHSSDDRSMTETPSSFRDQLRTARSFLADRPIVASPITLLARFNADAPGAGTIGLGEPVPADHRQASLLSAGFAAISLKNLAAGRAAAATFFETSGDRGVMAAAPEAGTAKSASGLAAGTTFPVYDVLSICSRWAGRPGLEVSSSDPRSVDSAACRVDDRLQVLIANTTADVQEVVFSRPSRPGAHKVRFAVMDAASVRSNRDAGRAGGFSAAEELDTARLELDLGPYAVVLVELESD